MSARSRTGLLGAPRWIARARPFPHVAAPDVFAPAVAGSIRRRVEQVLARSAGVALDADTPFVRPFPLDEPGALATFTSRWWHDLVARVAGVVATGDIDISIHHHPRGDAPGHVHNDLAPGWFPRRREQGAISVADADRCSYTTGETADGSLAREVVRGVAVVYFTASPRWRPGCGGEIGLFESLDDPVDRPSATMAPRNNSMIVFECRPDSYHAFLGNPAQERNAVVMWLHRPKQQVVRRWGEDSIVYW